MTSLGEVIQHLSLSQVPETFPIDVESSHAFLDQITQDILSKVPTYTPEVNNLTRKLITISKVEEREDNQIEFVTVLSIIKTINQIDALLSESLTSDSVRKINALLLSFTSLLKYHFQLPTDHNNYDLRNFGRLLACDKYNLMAPFVRYFKQCSTTFGEINKIEILEKTLCFICVVSCFNSDLFEFLGCYFTNEENEHDLKQLFDPASSPQEVKDTIPSLFSIMLRFRNMILLEESALVNDAKSTNLLNIMFYSSFHKSFLKHMILCFDRFKRLLARTPSCEELFDLASDISINSVNLDYLTLFVTSNTSNFQMLDDIAKQDDKGKQKSIDTATFLLLKISENYLLYYNIFKAPSNELLEYIVEYNNTAYTSLLGLNETNNICEVNISTLVPIFELYDQNFKLDFKKERDFLALLNLALLNLDLNLETEEDFMNLNSLLVDVGCSRSIHALLDILQTILCFAINKNKLNMPYLSKLPKHFEEVLGFDCIPPVYRSDLSFINNVDLQMENFGVTFKLLQNLENHSLIKEAKSLELLEHALLLVISTKSKVYKFLKELNNNSNVLRVPDLFTDESKQADFAINSFKQGVSTKIASFKSSKSLHYKLLNSSISLGTISNLSLLTISENYKTLKASERNVDNSLSRLLSEFTFEFSLNLILIYQEFGLLTLFKNIRELNYGNLNLIVPTSSLVAKLFQIKPDPKESEPKDFEQAEELSSLDLVTEILKKSVLASNLLRQFVEIFDNGQSKPFKSLNKFLKANPSTLKPSKISKGTVSLDINYYTNVLY